MSAFQLKYMKCPLFCTISPQFLATLWLCNMASLNRNAHLLFPSISYWFPTHLFSCSDRSSDHNICVSQWSNNCCKTPTMYWTKPLMSTKLVDFSTCVCWPLYSAASISISLFFSQSLVLLFLPSVPSSGLSTMKVLSGINILQLNQHLSKYGVNKYIDRRWSRSFHSNTSRPAGLSTPKTKYCWFLPWHA